MGASPETTAYLKECLADALIELLGERPLEKITISEIARVAGVGRTTYFRNFASKEDMLTFKLVRLWKRFAQNYSPEVKSGFSLSNARAFFEFNYNIRPLLELIYRRNLQSALYGAFREVLHLNDDVNPLGRYRNCFCSYGLYGVLDGWVSNGFRETPAQMEQIVTNILTDENGRALES